MATFVVVLVVLVPIAYLNGLWPCSLVCTVAGPSGARLVAVAGRSCDQPLPQRIDRWSAGLPFKDGDVVCPLEIRSGDASFRGRVRARPLGCLITAYMDLVNAAESMDGSAWLSVNTNEVEVRAPQPGSCLFAFTLWGRQPLEVDGVTIPAEDRGVREFTAGPGTAHAIRANGWLAGITADEGTSISLYEWTSDRPMVLLRCDDSGFVAGTLAAGDADPVALSDLGTATTWETERIDVSLQSRDGHSARVAISFLPGSRSHLTLRITR